MRICRALGGMDRNDSRAGGAPLGRVSSARAVPCLALARPAVRLAVLLVAAVLVLPVGRRAGPELAVRQPAAGRRHDPDADDHDADERLDRTTGCRRLQGDPRGRRRRRRDHGDRAVHRARRAPPRAADRRGLRERAPRRRTRTSAGRPRSASSGPRPRPPARSAGATAEARRWGAGTFRRSRASTSPIRRRSGGGSGFTVADDGTCALGAVTPAAARRGRRGRASSAGRCGPAPRRCRRSVDGIATDAAATADPAARRAAPQRRHRASTTSSSTRRTCSARWPRCEGVGLEVRRVREATPDAAPGVPLGRATCCSRSPGPPRADGRRPGAPLGPRRRRAGSRRRCGAPRRAAR